jgi:hypothetical protein
MSGVGLTSRIAIWATVSLLVAASAHAVSAECRVDTATLIAPPQDAASAKQFRPSWQEFKRIASSCSKGPSDPRERQALFRFVDDLLSLDYDRLCEVWLRDTPEKDRSGDGCFPEEKQKDIAAYLDKIVDPNRDQGEVDVILRHASASGIAKLGPAARDQVIAAATAESDRIGRRHPQSDAIRALGQWIDKGNRRFTDKEKRDLTNVLLSLLPPVEKVGEWPGFPMTVEACIEALGHAQDPLVSQRLQSWSIQYTRIYGPGTEMSELASKASLAAKPRAKSPKS